MTRDTPNISGEHKSMIAIECLHATVVALVVICASVLAGFVQTGIGGDTVGVVYGAAIAYAGGRASAARQVFRRSGDMPAGD